MKKKKLFCFTNVGCATPLNVIVVLDYPWLLTLRFFFISGQEDKRGIVSLFIELFSVKECTCYTVSSYVIINNLVFTIF